MRRLAALVLLLALGCAPAIYGHSPGQPLPFVVIVHNGDTAYAATASLSWWVDSTVIGSASRVMPAGGYAAFVLGPSPDGLEIDTTAWPAQLGGVAFGSPDYADAAVFHVAYPSGASWKEGTR